MDYELSWQNSSILLFAYSRPLSVYRILGYPTKLQNSFIENKAFSELFSVTGKDTINLEK